MDALLLGNDPLEALLSPYAFEDPVETASIEIGEKRGDCADGNTEPAIPLAAVTLLCSSLVRSPPPASCDMIVARTSSILGGAGVCSMPYHSASCRRPDR